MTSVESGISYIVSSISFAIKYGTGARGLRSLMEKLMLDTMYEIPDSTDIVSVKVTDKVVLGQAEPTFQRRQKKVAA